MASNYEYQVLYRRANWKASTADQSRIFKTVTAAEKFVHKLTGNARPDLAPVTWKVQRRTVGVWRRLTDSDGRGRL